MLHSLRSRLLVSVLAVNLVLALLLLGSGWSAVQDWVRSQVAADARVRQQLMSAATAPLLAELNLGGLQELLASSVSATHLVYATVSDVREGRVLAAAGQVPAAGSVEPQSADTESPRANDGVYHFAVPVALGGRVYGTLRFGIGAPEAEHSGLKLVEQALVIVIGGTLVSLLLLLLITGVLTRGLSRLSAAAGQIGAGRTHQLLPVRGRDEIGRLSEAFNEMARRLEQRHQALADADELQRAVSASLTEGVVVQDRLGQVLSANDAARRLFAPALPADALVDGLPTPFPPALHDQRGRLLDAALQPAMRALRSGVPVKDQLLRVAGHGGAVRWLRANAVPLRRGGEPIAHATVTSYDDVTGFVEGRERLEAMNQQLEQRVGDRTAALESALARAERASRAKSEFLARMSHELRTPMNAILGFVQLARRRPDVPADTRESLGEAERAGWQLLAMIDEVLDLSDVEAGVRVLQMQPVALPALLADATVAAAAHAAARGVALDLREHADSAAALAVQGDPARLRQVLGGLFAHAIEHCAQGGSVRISAGRPTAQEVALRIEARAAPAVESGSGSGSGSGSEPAPSPAPAPALAPGLGLVIMQRLLQAMGANLREELVEADARCWTVRLPAAEAAPEASLAALPAPPSARDTVLYVEDVETNVEVFRGMLSLRPHLRLEVAGDGLSGLARAVALRPGAVFVDIGLPGIDGVELCKRLRADPELRGMPLVALSANAMPKDVQRALQAGFDTYLTKPVEVQRLLAELDRLLPAAALESSP